MRIIKDLMALRYVIFICLLVHLYACGATKWYSVEEQPAGPIAYLSDGVYVLNDYIRSAIVTQIDGERVHQNTSNYFKINAGTHHVKVNCDEAQKETLIQIN